MVWLGLQQLSLGEVLTSLLRLFMTNLAVAATARGSPDGNGPDVWLTDSEPGALELCSYNAAQNGFTPQLLYYS